MRVRAERVSTYIVVAVQVAVLPLQGKNDFPLHRGEDHARVRAHENHPAGVVGDDESASPQPEVHAWHNRDAPKHVIRDGTFTTKFRVVPSLG